jgi:hypothetical protein
MKGKGKNGISVPSLDASNSFSFNRLMPPIDQLDTLQPMDR